MNLSRTTTTAFVVLLVLGACNPPRPRPGRPPQGAEGGFGGSRSDLVSGLGGAAFKPKSPSTSCTQPSSKTLSVTKKNLLRSTGECAQLRYCEFELAAEQLAHDARAYVESPSDSRLTELQQTLTLSLQTWARAELFRFGPAAGSAQDMENGKGLRDLIYSWPNVSRCRVEEQLFGQAYQEKGFDDLVSVPINSRGLFAVEYLSFYDAADNDCTAFSITNADDAWNQLSSDELVERKHSYLRAVSDDVFVRAQALVSAWAANEGNFQESYENSAGYMSQQEALNLTAHSLLYVELEVKDFKIGSPAELYESAPLERPEASFSKGGTLLIAQNLRGFRDLFQGCNGQGLGFDDLLEAANHKDLADDIVAALDEAQEAVEHFPDLADAKRSELEELHAVIKQLTDLLKSEFFGQGSPLGFTLPSAVEGDTD